MIRINLLPRERVRRPAVAPRLLVGLAFVVVAAALVLATLALNLPNARVRGEIDDVNARIEELKPKVAEVEALQRQIAEARRKEQLLRQLEGHAASAGADTVRLETNRSLTEAIALYRKAGYREVEAFNSEAYAHHWFEKRL